MFYRWIVYLSLSNIFITPNLGIPTNYPNEPIYSLDPNVPGNPNFGGFFGKIGEAIKSGVSKAGEAVKKGVGEVGKVAEKGVGEVGKGVGEVVKVVEKGAGEVGKGFGEVGKFVEKGAKDVEKIYRPGPKREVKGRDPKVRGPERVRPELRGKKEKVGRSKRSGFPGRISGRKRF